MYNPNGASNCTVYFGTEEADVKSNSCMGGIDMQLMSASPMERRY
jgi:hypothetical protein